MTSRFILEGLDCASCAGKIEKRINDSRLVSEARLSFVSKLIDVDHDRGETQEVLELVRKVVKEIEPHVKVHSEEMKKEETSELGKEYILMGFALTAFALSFFAGRLGLPLQLIAYVLSGYDVIYTALRNILKGRVFNEQFLMTLATFAAIFIGEYPEAAGVMLFYKAGEILEHIAVEKSRKGIERSFDDKIHKACYVNPFGRGIIMKDPEEIRPGDEIVVRKGERLLLDGTLLSDNAYFDARALTGESDMKALSKGDEVKSGYVAHGDASYVRVTGTYEGSTYAKLLDMIKEASFRKSKGEKMISKFAEYYTPVVVILAVLVAFIPPLIGLGELKVWIYRAAIFLVVSCPCALVISIPLVYYVALGKASRKGVVVKGSTFMDEFRMVDSFVFDKTGTITEDIPAVVNIWGDVLRLAAIGESISTHPVAKAILTAYGKQVPLEGVSDLKELDGRGISYKLNGENILVGSKELMSQNGIKGEPRGDILVAKGEMIIGGIFLDSKVKEGALNLPREVRERSIILSGDSEEKVKEAAGIVGIDSYKSRMMPEEKLAYISALKEDGNKVAFLGDGINDSPAMALADLSISMGGSGSDIALETSDVVFISDDIALLPAMIGLSKGVKARVMENVAFALAVKVGVMILSTLGMANMWMAVFADVGVALIAILNAGRLQLTKTS